MSNLLLKKKIDIDNFLSKLPCIQRIIYHAFKKLTKHSFNFYLNYQPEIPPVKDWIKLRSRVNAYKLSIVFPTFHN